MLLPKQLEAYLQSKEAFLDSFIEIGSEQELFAASYIHGHLSLVAAKEFATYADDLSNDELDKATASFIVGLNHSIQTAIDDKELSELDALDVKNMLLRLEKA